MGHFDTREPRLIPNLVNTDQVHIQSAVLIGSLLVYSAPCAELKAEWTVIVASSEFFTIIRLGFIQPKEPVRTPLATRSLNRHGLPRSLSLIHGVM